MTDIEARLEQALQAHTVAERDPMFRIQVLVRRERAALRRRLAIVGSTTLGVAILAVLGLEASGVLADGVEQLVPITAAGIGLTALVAELHLKALRPLWHTFRSLALTAGLTETFRS